MDGPESGTVPGSHILIEALDGICTCELAIFLVHVVCPRAGIVTEPDTEVLDLLQLASFREESTRPGTRT